MFNFKGFEHNFIEFGGATSLILGGKNGYGKTTIFDAIELAFTKKIKRFEEYLDNHDKKFKFNLEVVPLAYKKELPEVKVCVSIVLNGKRGKVICSSPTADIKNPIDFLSFEQKIEGELKDCYEEREYLTDLFNHYSFLNYISQEDTTAFLKSKDSDRSKAVEQLFDTKLIDYKITKIKDVYKILGEKLNFLKKKKLEIENELKGLKLSEKKDECDYNQISNGQLYWDMKDSELSYEEYDNLLKEKGIIDGICSYIDNRDNYDKWVVNQKIKEILDDQYFEKVPIYLWGIKNEFVVKCFSFFKNEIKPLIASESLNQNFLLVLEKIKNGFADVVSVKAVDDLLENLNVLHSMQSSENAIKNAVVKLIESREKLCENITNNAEKLKMDSCPLCGQKFKDSQQLVSCITEYKVTIENVNQSILNGSLALINVIKESFREKIEKPFNEIIDENIENKCKEYINVKKNEVLSVVKKIRDYIDLDNLDINDSQKCLENIKRILLEKIKDIPNDIDYNNLNKIHINCVRNIIPEMLNIEMIEKKRKYLSYRWNESQSEKYLNKIREKNMLCKQEKLCENYRKKISKLKNNLEDKREKYLQKVINDIEILFYIYSGRIMQDSYYGRGLFMKYSPKCRRVFFVTEYKSDVDALYNLSSGQLVSVVFAFILSLNQLYSRQKLIAIDDPIQTMDDINVWGFMENIRRSFKKHIIILSTHEKEYADLLCYKFKKGGIDMKFIDMGKNRNNLPA